MRKERKVRPEKQKQAEELKNLFSGAKGIVFVEFRGLKVADDTKLRKLCRESQVSYKVIKNTLALRAAREMGMSGLESVFQGPTAVAVSKDDPVVPAKTIHSFASDHSAIKVKGGIVEGSVVSADRVLYLATLPGKKELLAKMAGALRSPISGLVTVVNAPLAGVARALEGLRQKRVEQGGMSNVQG
ncbi:MAG TPA: 50S ribosomal protein L10 [Firmicutes bacterium]|nr:50S ribosomal protein L10 [Candidatus Fermentithermobacillaceae bacterium]